MAFRTKQTRGSVIGTTVVALVAAFGVFFLSPGMLVIFLAVRPFVALDRGQLWTFSAVTSVAALTVLRLCVGDSKRAGRWYAALCAAVCATFLLARFGFHAEWPDLMFDAFTFGR